MHETDPKIATWDLGPVKTAHSGCPNLGRCTRTKPQASALPQLLGCQRW